MISNIDIRKARKWNENGLRRAARQYFRPVKIYTLSCPIENRIYYVGSTTLSLKQRLATTYKLKTSIELKNKGLTPIIEVIDVTIGVYRYQMECYWLNQLRAWGFQMENSGKLSMRGYGDSALEIMKEFPEENLWGDRACVPCFGIEPRKHGVVGRACGRPDMKPKYFFWYIDYFPKRKTA